MRITNQYVWNFIFTLVFIGFLAYGARVLEAEAYIPYGMLTYFDLTLITLASFRFTRLMVYDKITAFFREQFFNATDVVGEVVLVKPACGARRTLADLLTCPWCFGVWATASVAFFYMLTPYAFFPILILALSSVATLLQLLANLIGWKAEQLKREVERHIDK